LYVLAIQFDSLEDNAYTRKDKDLLLFSINQIVSDIIREDEKLTPTVIDSTTQATIFICQNKNFEQHNLIINQYAEKIQKTVKEIFNLTISIGVSSPFERLTDCKQALKQGIEALKFRLKVGKESVIFYESVSAIFNSQQIKTYFPKIVENQLFDAIKLGESGKAKELLHQLFADLYKNNTNPHELEVSIMRFLNDLIGLMQVMGMETLIIENHKTIYNAISDMKTSEEIEMFVKNKIIYPMVDAIGERTDSQNKSISEKILAIIHNEYDTELSLEIIASRLHYNKNYLSSIFKKEFKQSFSEYLALYRYDMAKKWLLQTNMSVKEISERLQYKNSQNFIRSFRKIEGTTPGKYRDLHREDSFSFE
ncbi:helix-turn-helix transcriptional regulator, partial [Metabacillus niabensis]